MNSISGVLGHSVSTHARGRPGERATAVARLTRWDLGLVAAAFLVRLVYGVSSKLLTGGDAQQYLALAHNLASGHGYSLSQHAPYVVSDYRMPGYPALLAIVDVLGGGHVGIVFVNSLVGAAAVLAIALIAREVFGDHLLVRLVAVLAAAVYPPLVTYTSVAYAENLSIAALCWFVYVAFFQPVAAGRRRTWLIWLLLTSAVVTLTRSEGTIVVVVGVLLATRLRSFSVSSAVISLFVVLIAPAAWVVRNDVATTRLELSDSLYQNDTLLLSFNDGNLDAPLYLRGEALAYQSSTRGRSQYQHAVFTYIGDAIKHRPASVVAYKLKSLIDFPFMPVVWSWSAVRDYSLSDAVRDPTFKNLLRVAWSIILLAQYILAILGFRKWWREGLRRYTFALALYPTIAVLLAIPFHSEPRLWFGAAVLLIIPAAEGGRAIWHWLHRSLSDAAHPRLVTGRGA